MALRASPVGSGHSRRATTVRRVSAATSRRLAIVRRGAPGPRGAVDRLATSPPGGRRPRPIGGPGPIVHEGRAPRATDPRGAPSPTGTGVRRVTSRRGGRRATADGVATGRSRRANRARPAVGRLAGSRREIVLRKVVPHARHPPTAADVPRGRDPSGVSAVAPTATPRPVRVRTGRAQPRGRRPRRAGRGVPANCHLPTGRRRSRRSRRSRS